MFGLGADWMNDHADVALPWALVCVMTSRPLTRFLSNFTPIISQRTRTQIRYGLLRLDAAPKCSAADDLQRARSRPRRCSLAMGHRAQTGTLRKTGPHRLRRGASPRRRVAQRTIRWTLAGLEQCSRSLASILVTKVQCCRALLRS